MKLPEWMKSKSEIARILRQKRRLIVFLAIFITFAAFIHYSFAPVDSGALSRTVFIPKGASFLNITEILDDAGLVKNRPFFWLLALGRKAARQIRPGEYELNGAMSPSRILEKLVRGEIKIYHILLQEDITASEVARKLAVDRLVDVKEFMALATDRSFLDSLDIEADSIEGYLFPNTYRFDRSMTCREIIQILVGQFWREATPEMRKRAREMGMTIPQWVTLASIIGKESGNSDEKPQISAVFHNRLRKGMKLQSDPTAVYSLDRKGGRIKTVLSKHLKADTPHNTYRISGLPPGPIANPGADSLRAALYPAKVDYLYFVSRRDGTHQFSTNLAGHNRAISKYQINR